MAHVSRKAVPVAAVDSRQQFFLYGGGILLLLSLMAFLMPHFLALLDTRFSTHEAMGLLLVGSALLAVERKTSVHIQRLVIYIVGSIGLVVGSLGLLVSFGFTRDVLHVVTPHDVMRTLIYFTMGVWAVMAGFMKEKRLTEPPRSR